MVHTSHVEGGTAGRAGAETRERILIASVGLFLRQGFAGTSVRDITRQTQLTKAALYYHFASKEAVLDAVVEPLAEEMRSLVQATAAAPGVDPEQVLRALVDVLSRRVGVLRILMADPSVTRKPDRRRAQEGMERLAQAIARSQDPADLVAARCAIAAAQGGVVATVVHSDIMATPPDQDRLRRLLAGEEHSLDDGQRQQVVAAAMRALG